MVILDGNIRNADWLRRWPPSLVREGVEVAVRTVADLLEFLGVKDMPVQEQRQAVRGLLSFPIAEGMPDGFRRRLQERGLL